jgi:hypothetical protein
MTVVHDRFKPNVSTLILGAWMLFSLSFGNFQSKTRILVLCPMHQLAFFCSSSVRLGIHRTRVEVKAPIPGQTRFRHTRL